MNNLAMVYCVATCVIIFTLFSIALTFRKRRHLFKQASKFPGPPTLPIVGNAHLFSGDTEAILNKVIQLGKLYSAPYRLWLGNYLIFVINTPEQFKVTLHSPKTMDRGDLLQFAVPWLGTGLVTASGAKWRVHRKLIQPTFCTTILHSFVEVFCARSVITAEEIERYLDRPEFDIFNYTSRYALYTICETTMGVNLGEQTNDNNLYAETLEKIGNNICRQIVSPWLHPDFIFRNTRLGRDQQGYIKFVHTFTKNVIQTKKKELLGQRRRSGTTDDEEDSSSWIPRKRVFLDHLIEASHDSKILSDEELREEVVTIMAAGSDTTAVTSSYVMLMLASHPDIQDKVYRELCEIYGGDESEERDVTPGDLTRMTYLERVIKETMRLFPLVPLIPRSVTHDLVIGEQTLPAGSQVAISVIELHRNGDIWPDPLKFDPDRFLPEEVQKRHPFAYLPFGGGPRNCIGSKYGMMSMKVLFATILRRYVLKKDNIVPVENLRLKWEFLMRPVDPIMLRIERRSRNVASI